MQANGVCRTCDHPIFWGLTEQNRRFIPMDPEATANGNCWIDHYENGVPVINVGSSPAAIPANVALRYLAHWATCPTPPARRNRYSHEVRT